MRKKTHLVNSNKIADPRSLPSERSPSKYSPPPNTVSKKDKTTDLKPKSILSDSKNNDSIFPSSYHETVSKEKKSPKTPFVPTGNAEDDEIRKKNP